MPNPPGFIRSNAEAKKWELAKNLGRQRAIEHEKDKTMAPIENIWAYITYLYKNVIGKENPNTTALVQEEKGIIESDDQDSIYETIKNHILANKTQLSEEEQYSLIEDIYLNYIKENKHTHRQKILEFTNTYGNYNKGGVSTSMITPNGLIGGYRDEMPKGPYLYGANDYENGTENGPRSNSKNIIVPIPDKKSTYNPETFDLDNQGNVVNDVENTKKVADEKLDVEKSLNGDFGDVLNYIMQHTDYSINDLQDMNANDFQNIIKKLLKKELNTNTVMKEEYVITEVAKNSSIQQARKILALKHKQKKSLQKDGRKYILNQNDVIKLMSKFGYKFNKKFKKWLKKRSPTYDARRILHDKYQDMSAMEKNDLGQYVLDQDEVRKRMHSHKYFYNLDKKVWEQRPDSIPSNITPKPIEPDKKPEVPQKQTFASIYAKPPNLSTSNDEKDIKPKEKIDKDEPDDSKKDIDDEKFVNPLNLFDIKNKMKYMQARYILSISFNKNEYSEFIKNEETDEYIPTISDKEVLEKIELLKYYWDDVNTIWKDDSNYISNKLLEFGESPKTLVARSYLATLNKFKNIKIKKDGEPVVSIDELDDAMENEDFYFNDNIKKWLPVHEEELDENIFYTDINEKDYDDEPVYTESIDVINEAVSKTIDEPKPNFNYMKVMENQARFLHRCLQLNNFKTHFVGTPYEMTAWNSIQTGGDNDATSKNCKLTLNKIEAYLKLNKYNFNNDKFKPMWVEGSSIPKILSDINIDEKDYIARGILSQKDESFIRYDESNVKSNPVTPLISKDKVEMQIENTKPFYVWNDDYGWVDKKQNDMLISPHDKSHRDFLSSIEHVDYNNLSKSEKDKVKESTGYKFAQNIFNYDNKTNLTWDKMNNKQRNQAMKKLRLNYVFNKDKKTWEKAKTPNRGFIKRSLGFIGKIINPMNLSSNLTNLNAKLNTPFWNSIKNLGTNV